LSELLLQTLVVEGSVLLCIIPRGTDNLQTRHDTYRNTVFITASCLSVSG